MSSIITTVVRLKSLTVCNWLSIIFLVTSNCCNYEIFPAGGNGIMSGDNCMGWMIDWLFSDFGSMPSPKILGIIVPPKTLEDNYCQNGRNFGSTHTLFVICTRVTTLHSHYMKNVLVFSQSDAHFFVYIMGGFSSFPKQRPFGSIRVLYPDLLQPSGCPYISVTV